MSQYNYICYITAWRLYIRFTF